MNTWAAGALFTERANGGSIGRPAAEGIAILSGGSSAASTALGRASGLRCVVACSSSLMIRPLTSFGGGVVHPPASAASRMHAVVLVVVILAPLFASRPGPLLDLGKEFQDLRALRGSYHDLALRDAHDAAVAEFSTEPHLLAADHGDPPIRRDQHRFEARTSRNPRRRLCRREVRRPRRISERRALRRRDKEDDREIDEQPAHTMSHARSKLTV